MKKIVVIILSLLSFTTASSQVLADAFIKSITGKSDVIRNKKKYALKANSLIYKNDSIKVLPGSRIVLLNYDTKYIDVNKPGTYSYKQLESKIGKPSGISAKMFHLLVEEFAHGEKISLASKTTIGRKILGVKRGDEDCESIISPFELLNTIDESILFSWHPVPGAREYEFNLTDDVSGKMIKTIATDTFVIISRNALLKGEKNSFTWNVKPGNDQCSNRDFHFTVYTDKKEKELTDEIIKQIPADSNEIFYNLRVSQVLAEQLWLNRSIEYYIKARDALLQAQQ